MMINTLLDNDFYQFTMAYCLWAHGHADYQVKYEFRNRTFAVPLGARLDLGLLQKQIDAVRQLSFRPDEIEYLRSLNLFDPGFLHYLQTIKLPPVEVGSNNGHLTMSYQGDWATAIFWETPLLAIVNEMYYERFVPEDYDQPEGIARLMEKVEYLRDRGTIKFVEFGTRRRFSQDWQRFVTETVQDKIPDLLLGTSNVFLAKELGLTPVGTMAHQLFMVFTALFTRVDHIDLPVRAGTNLVLEEWGNVYRDHPQMMTALPDTYTTQKFIDCCDLKALEGFTAFRQDSGDPIWIGHVLAALSRGMDVPPKIIFSDSLDVRRMSVIEDAFPDVETLFGWGTNLTNDLGYEPLSIVIKPCAVQSGEEWVPCVKISDDIQKATGDPDEVQKYLDWLA